MICYMDRSFCISPNCENKCGRKLTDEVRDGARRKRLPICTGYFCDKPVWHEAQRAADDDGSAQS